MALLCKEETWCISTKVIRLYLGKYGGMSLFENIVSCTKINTKPYSKVL